MAQSNSDTTAALRRHSVEFTRFADRFEEAASAAEAAPPGSNDALVAETRARALRAMAAHARSSATEVRHVAERIDSLGRPAT